MFIPIALGGFLGAFALGMRLFKDRLVAFTAAVFYGSTPYFLLVQSVHGPIAVIYAFLPLLVLVLDNAIERNRLRDWLLLSLGFCVGIFYEVRIMYIAAFILAVYFVGAVLIRKRRIRQYVKPIGIAGLLLVAVNLFWLIPTKLAAGAGIDQTAEGKLFGNALFNLAQSFTVMRWNWTGGALDRTFMAQPVPPYLWIIPVIAFISVLTARHIRKLLLFVVIALIGIFLTKQSAEPLTGAYAWLFAHFPGFGVFREASKFYILVAFGYFGMIGYTLLSLRERYRHTNWRYIYGLVIAAVLAVSAINLWPAASQQLAGTFKDKPVPADYQTFASFVKSQPDFFRTYWLPRESWWGYYDNQHPRVRAAEMLERDWQSFAGTKGGSIYEVARKNTEFLKQPFAESLLSESSVKYVVVPIRDTASDDDFFPSYGNDRQYFINQLDSISYLKRIDIGTKELAVYENTSFKPYIGTASEVYAISNVSQSIEQTAFVATIADNFVTAGIPVAQYGAVPLGTVDTLFALQGRSNVPDQNNLVQTKQLPSGSYVRVGQKAQRYSYTVQDNTVSLIQEASGSLTFNDQVVDAGQPQMNIGTRQLQVSPARPYYLAVGERVVPLNTTNGMHEIGSTTDQVRIVQVTADNSVRNASFDDGPWSQVFDCNNTNSRLISMEVAPDGTAGAGNVLNLYAQRRQAACVSQQRIPVASGTYLLQFNYQNQGGEQVGYSVTFNDSRRTLIEKQLPVADGQWRQYNGLVAVPEGATYATLTLKGYAGAEQDKGAVSSYDMVTFARTTDVLHTEVPADGMHDIYVTGTSTFTFKDVAVSTENSIRNGSFEQGGWQAAVGDCHNYDERPVIGMHIVGNARAGAKALRLESTRHIACTYQDNIPVHSNTPYAFGFDYKAVNTNQVHYRLAFDDPAKTIIDTYVPVAKAGSWQHHTTAIQAPLGARTVTVRVEAVPNAYGKQHVSIDFDDFTLTQASSALNTYHTVAPAGVQLTEPRAVAFRIVSPTRKEVTITGAATPFYLTMHEKYDKYWHMTIDGKTVTDAGHFPINGSLNAWYVDVPALCAKPAAHCVKNADGTYAIRAVIEFMPQRVFSGELVVSGIAFTGALTYVVVDWYRYHKRRRYARAVRHSAPN
jgi:hypothetical protein